MPRYVAKDMYLKAQQLIGPIWIVEKNSIYYVFSVKMNRFL